MTGVPPSKVRVTWVMIRSGSPVWGWTRVSELTVRGWVEGHLPPLAERRTKESSSQAVWVFPSRAAAGRSSGR